MVVIAAGRDEGGARAVARGQLEAEHAAIEGEGALDVGHLEVDVADARARIDRRAERGLRNAGLHVRVQHAANLGAAGRGGQRPIGGQSVPGSSAGEGGCDIGKGQSVASRRPRLPSAHAIRRPRGGAHTTGKPVLMNKEHLEVARLRSSRPRRPRPAGAEGAPSRSARQRRGSGPARRPPAPARSPHRAPAPDPGRLSPDLGGASRRARRRDAHLARRGLRDGDLLRPFRRGEGGRRSRPAAHRARLRQPHLRHARRRGAAGRAAGLTRASRAGRARRARALRRPLRPGAGGGGRAQFPPRAPPCAACTTRSTATTRIRTFRTMSITTPTWRGGGYQLLQRVRSGALAHRRHPEGARRFRACAASAARASRPAANGARCAASRGRA